MRALFDEGEFIEVFVDTPLELAERARHEGPVRQGGRAGRLPNLTGVDSPYEPPEEPEVHLDDGDADAEEAAERVVAALRERGLLERSA